LADASCKYVLVGHSERRQIMGETNEILNRKFEAAQAAGLTPILCIGETLEQREAGKTLEVVGQQLDSIIEELGIGAFANAVIAYEPVWAIGTGLTASPQQAQEVHAAIRAQLMKENSEVAQGVRLLYGGSVKAANAVELFGMPDIDGGLIGGASLNADEFGAIIRAAGN
jgi:triosephosphate isomerase